MISFPMNTVIIINIIVCVILLTALLIGYFIGFIRQFFDLVILIVGLIIAWPTSLALSKAVPILTRNLNQFDDILFGQFSYEVSNIFVWFIIILILVSIGLYQIIKPIIKQVKHIKWMKQVDKILGIFIAFIPQLIWILLFMSIVLSPLMANGKSTLEATVLKPLVPVAQYVSDSIVNQVDPYGIVAKVTQNQELNEEDKSNIPVWLEEFGIPEDKVEIVEKFIQEEEFTETDESMIQDYINENEITETTARLFLERFGLTQEEINESIKHFNFQ